VFAYIFQGMGYGFAAAAQPGPFQAFALSQAMRRGWQRALPIALAPLISDGPIIALVLLILRHVPPWLQHALYLAGGLFVLYLAWGTFLSWRAFAGAPPVEPALGTESVFKAALINALSPGPYLYWSLVTGPILVAGWRQAPIIGIGFLGGFYASMVGTLIAQIVLFGTAHRLGARVNRALIGLSALALAAFGLYQVWRGLSGIVLG
jgi:threonine/homoserine/homoserine lactone efflux protein